MPSEHAQSQSAQRVEPDEHRSTSSIHSQTDSPSTTPPQPKQKVHKHVVGRPHARVPSNKGLHKLTKTHGNEGSHTDLKKLQKKPSATDLKLNTSHVSLKRNRSSTDVPKRPKSSHGQVKRPASVHFEIGDQDDLWEEASSSASPVLSRSLTRSAVSSNHSSTKPSANNSQPHSPIQSHSSENQGPTADGSNDRQTLRLTTDAKIITERLLQRTHSLNTTKMSLATATPAGHLSESLGKSQVSTLNGTPKIGSKEELVSRFVGGSGTPSENSPFPNNSKSEGPPKHAVDDLKKAKSMGNLSRPDQNRDNDQDDEGESALAPRSRKSSSTHAYNPLQQSRTQQKLWLQRASSNIEPQQMTPGAAINGLAGIHGGLGGSSLVGAGYDGRDPRIKIQLERTGLEYLVVRRHQDPVGQALKRLGQLPGGEHSHQNLPQLVKKSDEAGAMPYVLSQSLKESRRSAKDKTPVVSAGGSSYEVQASSQDSTGLSGRTNEDDDGVGSILRSIWEKNFDLSASTD